MQLLFHSTMAILQEILHSQIAISPQIYDLIFSSRTYARFGIDRDIYITYLYFMLLT